MNCLPHDSDIVGGLDTDLPLDRRQLELGGDAELVLKLHGLGGNQMMVSYLPAAPASLMVLSKWNAASMTLGSVSCPTQLILISLSSITGPSKDGPNRSRGKE